MGGVGTRGGVERAGIRGKGWGGRGRGEIVLGGE